MQLQLLLSLLDCQEADLSYSMVNDSDRKVNARNFVACDGKNYDLIAAK